MKIDRGKIYRFERGWAVQYHTLPCKKFPEGFIAVATFAHREQADNWLWDRYCMAEKIKRIKKTYSEPCR